MADTIIIQELYITNDERIRPYYQYCYDAIISMLPEKTDNNLRNPGINFTLSMLHYQVTKNDKICYIPHIYASIMDECLPEIIPNNWVSPGGYPEDTIQDYIQTVEETMGIDMKKNYRAQHNGDNLQITEAEASTKRVQSEEV